MTAVGTSGTWASTFAVTGLSTTWRSIHTWRGRQETTGLGLAEVTWATIPVYPQLLVSQANCCGRRLDCGLIATLISVVAPLANDSCSAARNCSGVST